VQKVNVEVQEPIVLQKTLNYIVGPILPAPSRVITAPLILKYLKYFFPIVNSKYYIIRR